MTDASRVLVAVRVPVSATRAFAAFTEEIDRWWTPNGLFRITDRTDGRLRFEPGVDGRLVEAYPDGSAFVVGDIRVWEPPRRFVVTWRHATFADDQETELHVRFDEVDEALTRVTVEHFGWDRIPPEHVARHRFPLATFQMRWAEWWQAMLGRLGEVADR